MGGGPSGEVTNAQLSNANAQTALMTQQTQQGAQLFNLTEPGLGIAENYYKALSSGDPNKIFTAIAPATEQINAQSARAAQQITENTPRGGVQQLALAQNQIQKSGQIGNLATSAYTGSFQDLAALAGQGIGLSVNEISNAIAAASASNQALGNVGQEQAAGKASSMGFLGSLVSAAGEIGAAAV